MPDPRVYLSGRFSTGTEIESAWLKRTGCKFRCFSFANLHPEAVNYSIAAVEALKVCEKNGIGIMMDSGAHTFHKFVAQTKRRSKISDSKKSIDIEALKDVMYGWYVDYCKQNKRKWNFYVTLDYKRHQPTIYRMQRKFIHDGLMPVPVYHGDTELQWLKKYRDLGCKLIAVGTGGDIRGAGFNFKRYRFFFDRVFEFCHKHDIKVHGLAITSMGLITAYPWWSVDSSTWVRASIYGMIAFPDRDKNVTYNLHISERKTNSGVASYNNLPKMQRDKITSTIKELGFNLKELRDDKNGLEGRHTWNGMMFANIFNIIDTKKIKHVEWERLV